MISKERCRLGTNDTDYCIEGYERLCAAIVERAAIDYKGALLRLRRHPYDTSAQRMVSDCERFFRNEISMYVDMDGEMIMNKIRENVERQVVR